VTFAVCATLVISVLIVGYTIKLLSRLQEDPLAAAQGPAILTMMGIAGTFLGMVAGLWSFDVNNGQSVPALIGGIRIAAIASLLGVLCAIIVKYRFVHRKQEISSESGKTDADIIIARLSELVDHLDRRLPEHYGDRVIEKLSSLQQALVGQDDSTITTQLKLLRQDSNDRLKLLADKSDAHTRYMSDKLTALQRAIVGDEATTLIMHLNAIKQDTNTRLDNLIYAQEAFMKQLAELGSKALVEALNEILRDFNKNLTEQFGENFKHLNVAVAQLVQWQQQYSEQLQEIIKLEERTVQAMSKATIDYQEMVNQASSLTTAAKNLESVLSGIDAYKENLKRSINQLAEITLLLQKELPGTQKQVESLISAVRDATSKNEAEIKRIAQDISTSFRAASESIKNDLTESLKLANTEVSENIKRLIGSSKEQTEALELQLEDSLRRSLESLSQQLAALSNKFAQDYSPITDKLREIVRIGVIS
jgi:hypothetical protein